MKKKSVKQNILLDKRIFTEKMLLGLGNFQESSVSVLSTELEDTVHRVSILASWQGILQPHLQRDSEQRIQAVNTQILLNESSWMHGEQSGRRISWEGMTLITGLIDEKNALRLCQVGDCVAFVLRQNVEQTEFKLIFSTPCHGKKLKHALHDISRLPKS
jgi:hypothetical protein